MWTAHYETLSGANNRRYTLSRDAKPALVTVILEAWKHDADFRAFWNTLLADAPYAAFRWETPAVTTHTLNRPFEFVLLDSPRLDRAPDFESFAQYIGGSAAPVETFTNLGGDAILIVPCQQTAPTVYVHLATFVRGAPAAQQQALWQSVGQAMSRRLGDRPIWLSTAGAGVAWLHLRLDDRPKYYGHAPYRSAPQQ
jgi:hypothetical protein